MREGGHDMAEMPTAELTLHEGEPVYSIGELLALYSEFANAKQPPDDLPVLYFLTWLAARDIGPRLRPTVRLT